MLAATSAKKRSTLRRSCLSTLPSFPYAGRWDPAASLLPARRYGSRAVLTLSACSHDAAFGDAHFLPDGHRGLRGLVQGADGSVVHAHANLVGHGVLHVLFDLVAGVGAGAGADHRRDRPPAPLANLVAQDTADHGAAHRSRPAALALDRER